ncbi:hypothetical protein CEUSTIGMA_g1800.t1 [Chlamydomonas eustigma]|uniref:Pherophorin domain-containing protein n=1 Tax=Chlamydomonas eustigma TaxID=1157962 RepID=A0A250WU55_9CHLO|nr:hypothetical protein CEUSTIGMA_g1800.t1 [Chlamydomonas eustigma]|eukprot:GAX74351.1 hypothetical protein CEUSTIGMA_g1800.t1 [Chlamydomonas eustigma]
MLIFPIIITWILLLSNYSGTCSFIRSSQILHQQLRQLQLQQHVSSGPVHHLPAADYAGNMLGKILRRRDIVKSISKHSHKAAPSDEEDISAQAGQQAEDATERPAGQEANSPLHHHPLPRRDRRYLLNAAKSSLITAKNRRKPHPPPPPFPPPPPSPPPVVVSTTLSPTNVAILLATPSATCSVTISWGGMLNSTSAYNASSASSITASSSTANLSACLPFGDFLNMPPYATSTSSSSFVTLTPQSLYSSTSLFSGLSPSDSIPLCSYISIPSLSGAARLALYTSLSGTSPWTLSTVVSESLGSNCKSSVITVTDSCLGKVQALSPPSCLNTPPSSPMATLLMNPPPPINTASTTPLISLLPTLPPPPEPPLESPLRPLTTPPPPPIPTLPPAPLPPRSPSPPPPPPRPPPPPPLHYLGILRILFLHVLIRHHHHDLILLLQH